MAQMFLFFFLIVFGSTNGLAANGYYTIKERIVTHHRDVSDMNPLNASEDFLAVIEKYGLELSSRFYSLVSFDYHQEQYGDVNEPYQRNKHFGTWLIDQRSNSCMNTRGVVLERESLIPVSTGASGCTVEKGRWEDPYSKKTFRMARDLQIDHFVPLKNAYISGAYKWSPEKRCLYSNFLGNDYHLIPVLGFENSSKGDQGPEGYMPPNKAYHCQYLAQWLKVKLIWALALTPQEKAVVLSMIKSNQCSPDDFLISDIELTGQREFITDNMYVCE